MIRNHVTAGLIFAALIAALPFATTPARAQDSKVSQKVVIHLKHYTDDLHAVNMALKLGSALQKKGAAVTLMLDLDGVRLADARQPQDLRWGGETPIATYYEDFVRSGGKMLVCPHCAHAAGLTDENLRDGARIGNEGDLAQLILDADKVLDY